MPKFGYSQHNNGAARTACALISRLVDRARLVGTADFFDGAARLKRAKKFVESNPLPMLRMLLASPMRWIVPGPELKLEISKVFTHGEIKNKTIQGRASASWPVTIGTIWSFSTSADASSPRKSLRSKRPARNWTA